MTSKRLEQYRNLVGNFKAAKEIGRKVTGYAEWPTICIDSANKLSSACADLLARLEIAEEALQKALEDGPTLDKDDCCYSDTVYAVVKEALAKINSEEEIPSE